MSRPSEVKRRGKDVAVDAMVAAGISQAKISEALGLSPRAIRHYLDNYSSGSQLVDIYQKNRARIFQSEQAAMSELILLTVALLGEDVEALRGLSPTQKSSLIRDLTWAKSVTYDKERLETGKSTANIQALHAMIDHQRRSFDKLQGAAKEIARKYSGDK